MIRKLKQKDKEIECQNKLIKELQRMLPTSSESEWDDTKAIDGCRGCGSTSGCYCK